MVRGPVLDVADFPAGRRRFDPGRPLHDFPINSRLFSGFSRGPAEAIFRFTQYAPKVDRLNARTNPERGLALPLLLPQIKSRENVRMPKSKTKTFTREALEETSAAAVLKLPLPAR